MSDRSPRAALVIVLLAVGCGADERGVTERTTEVPDRCGQCHDREFRRARRPPHVGYKPTTCGVCHLESAWRPTTLRHSYALTGAHVTADCFGCHRGNPAVFLGTPTVCVRCHAEDARAVRSPSHERFSTTCTDCHTTRAWSPTRRRDAAESDDPTPSPTPSTTTPTHPTPHPAQRPPRTQPAQPPQSTPPPPAQPAHAEHPEARFPITRGNHARIACQTCHRLAGPDGRDNTDCVQCHPRSRWDDVHDHVGRYPRGAAAPNFCVSCHQRGTRSRR